MRPCLTADSISGVLKRLLPLLLVINHLLACLLWWVSAGAYTRTHFRST